MSNLTTSGITRQQNKSLKPIISLTFDDGYQSDINIVSPILQENGIRGTFNVIGYDGEESRPSYYMSDAQIKEMSALGHEIGCHTNSHPRLTEITDVEIINEWTTNKAYLEGVTGKPVYTHAYPYGARSEQVDHLAGGIFEATRGTYHGIVKDPFDIIVGRRELSVMLYGSDNNYNAPSISTDGLSVYEMKQLIDRFIALPEATYMTFYMHRVYEDGDASKPTDRQTESQFREWVEYLGGLKKQGLVDVLPFIEGIRKLQTARSVYL